MGKIIYRYLRRLIEYAQVVNDFMPNLKVTSGFPGKVIYLRNVLYKAFSAKILENTLKL